MSDLNLGFALCGSYCTFDKVIPQIEELCEKGVSVIPIMSEHAYKTNTRFGESSEFIAKIEKICKKEIIHTIVQAEPVGPKKLLDVLVIAPCTGNTLAKLNYGITDSCVTMAAKAHLRNERPIVIGIATNDALSGNAANIGALLNRKNIYFVPFSQDDPLKKPYSMVADMSKIYETVEEALAGRQIQPIII